MRWMQPIRCSTRIGFQGRSWFTMRLQNWRFRPSFIASVETRTPPSSRKHSMTASFSSLEWPPWKAWVVYPSWSSVRRIRSCVARNCVNTIARPISTRSRASATISSSRRSFVTVSTASTASRIASSSSRWVSSDRSFRSFRPSCPCRLFDSARPFRPLDSVRPFRSVRLLGSVRSSRSPRSFDSIFSFRLAGLSVLVATRDVGPRAVPVPTTAIARNALSTVAVRSIGCFHTAAGDESTADREYRVFGLFGLVGDHRGPTGKRTEGVTAVAGRSPKPIATRVVLWQSWARIRQ